MGYPFTLTIAMHGKKQAGKSTSARHILKLLEDELYPKFGVNIDYRIFSFATVMKDVLCKLFGIQPGMLYGSDVCKNSTAIMVPVVNIVGSTEFVAKNELGAFLTIDSQKIFYDVSTNENLYPLSHRQLMQLFGKMMRAIDPNCFVNTTMREIDNFFASESSALVKVAIIDDCRMDNEAETVLMRGGHVIHLTRSPHTDSDVSEKASWAELEILEQGLAIRMSDTTTNSLNRIPKNIYRIDNQHTNIDVRNSELLKVVQCISNSL